MSIGPSGEDSPRVDPMILNEGDSAVSFETLCSCESNTSKSADGTPLYVSRDSPFNTDQTTDNPSPSTMTSERQPSLPPIISPQFKEEVTTAQGGPQLSVPRLSPPQLSLTSQVNIPSGSKLSSQHVFSKAPLANKKNEPHPGQDREKVDSLALGLDFDVGATANVMSVLPSRTETPTGISLSTQPPLANNEGMDASTHVPKGRKKSKHRVKREDHEASLADSQEGCSRKRRKVEKGEAPDPSPVPACKNRGSNGSKKSDRTGRRAGTSRSRSRIRSDKASGDEASRICDAPSSSLPLSSEELPPRPGSPSLDPHIVSPPSTEPNAQARVELTGMLVECLGTSRASSMAPSALYTTLIRSHPALKTVERTKREWITLISSVLEEVGERCGMFGRVESSGKDEKDRPLEARWFYVPEKDEDQERAVVITSLMPRPAKRSETKKYKQYYYRPLDKISRWDPEDAI
ncbi:hypothetical protein SERLA73DRAFT_160295 [Serpula lacrymans var. lacrymans S7.3]|uniref:Uncharacterized protein n=2 Tax=Serpula lacrymans var. lacrymans TaxID=341189 RepID=F8PUB4_SERL3|nr:uncharacterized protein SERLADRAFT_415326 [Serpula lacrymans var. lacrymans S7.9]EGO00427.1 hypothetical protein SERLA73DRAFT_160295 [Serpula lacrymans var. lacrymans S7.3]EGO25985.1 hypothetical protein SERLADRAFT_415326 [Serpula lacrymans var. lacrymans S7.9]